LTEAVQRGQHGGLIPAGENPVQIASMINAVVDGFAHAAASAEPIEMDAMNRLFDALLLGSADPHE
jgi:hypothetical protein